MLWNPKSSFSLTSAIVPVGTIRPAAGLAKMKPKELSLQHDISPSSRVSVGVGIPRWQ